MNTKVIALLNEKGGVGKSSSAAAIAYLLAQQGKKTALIDFDGQAHSSLLCGVTNVNQLPTTIATLLGKIIMDEPLPEPESYIINNNGVDLIPSNSQLFTLERNLCNVDFRELILKRYVDTIKERYEYIIIDTMPQIGTPMMNVLLCSDSIIIPTQAELLSAVGMTELVRHCNTVRKSSGHNLTIEGLLITMYDKRTRLSQDILEMLEASCQSQVRIFNTKIPRSVKVGEASLYGKNICEYLPASPVSRAYEDFVKELMSK